jgi:hypothetical protein
VIEVHLPPAVERLPRHRARLGAACRTAMAQPDVVGMTIGGSFAEGDPDEVSDLDLRIVVEDAARERRLEAAPALAAAAGPLVAAFTGEHVGEPRLVICLYEDLVHVDYLTVGLSETGEQNGGRPVHVLWERDGRVSAVLPGPAEAEDPADHLAWMEARMWTWAWYIQSKVIRGELFEALDGIQYVRDRVLFRLLAMRDGVALAGSRRAEARLGDLRERFDRTAARADRPELMVALAETVALYDELAAPLLERHGVEPASRARATVRAALDLGLAWRPPAPGSLG